MCSGGLFRALVCSVIALGCSFAADSDGRGLLRLKAQPKIGPSSLMNCDSEVQVSDGMAVGDLINELTSMRIDGMVEQGGQRVVGPALLEDSDAKLQAPGSVWKRPLLLLEEGLETLKQGFSRSLVVSLVDSCVVGVLSAGTGRGAEEQGNKEMARGKLLKELMDKVYGVPSREYIIAFGACRCALVANKRLDAAVWQEYADAAIESISTDQGAPEATAAINRLGAAARTAARVGSIDAVREIVSRAERTGIHVDLAADENIAITMAFQRGYTEVVAFLFMKKEERAHLYGGIDPAAGNNCLIGWAANGGHVEIVKLLLAKKKERADLYGGIDPAARENQAFALAAQNGHVQVVALLLEVKEEDPDLYKAINPAAQNNYAIRLAAKNGHIEVVKLLLEKKEANPGMYSGIDPVAAENYAIRWASANGHIEIVKLLLTKKESNPGLYGGIDPTAQNNFAIVLAIADGHIEVVSLLLMKKKGNPELYRGIDPTAEENLAIKLAAEDGHLEMVELLLGEKENDVDNIYGHQKIDPAVDDNYAIKNASRKGYNNVVEYLLRKKSERFDLYWEIGL